MNAISKLTSLALALAVFATVPVFESCKTSQPARTQLSDSAITTKVKAKLAADPDVAGRNVDVNTEEGTVYLTGRVKTQKEKDEAERMARETDGVMRVVNHLNVGAMTDTRPAGYDKDEKRN
jgi:hyperosmotically inducible periplasmic protein